MVTKNLARRPTILPKTPVNEQHEVQFPDPPFVRVLFSSTKFAWLFLIIRLFLGYSWLTSGWGKLNNPAWMESGAAILGFWKNAVTIPETGRPPIAYDWYRSFIQFLIDTESHTWFAKLIVYGEILVGIGLVVGGLVGFAAFFGALMNFNFMLAGTASTNPVMFTLAIILMLGWKVAGYYGLDYYLLPLLGTPWGRNKPARPAAATA
ncbi:DoxX family membrane protein [Chloroflexus sp.]|uniref:DoxX family membrane protein n=1 Tax=Chloroflexus sp. TaxID=1904827 RepID=UPI00262D51D6|nr:DoxX family membrane protein [uncultured Chloroflexus sp.]